MSHTGSPAKVLPEEARQSAFPPADPPLGLIQNARAFGVELGGEAWAALDEDQRYALIKLGHAKKASHNLGPALREFFSKDSMQGNSDKKRFHLA